MPRKPVPEPSADSRPHWEGLAAGRLLLQRCGACGRVRHYPRPLCDSCHSFAVDWVEASGEAAVHSWTVAHHPFHPAFRPDLPYTLVTADLPEGVRLLAQLRGAGPEALRIGLPLRIGFEENGEGLTLPVFRLRD
ncbi:Zn-ribbon domain-containing OB-fold protein [Roseicella aerolata]|uniref:Zn-ribbon domain-containing OB-fold protein n=1 Tax=Roseicella aerolata TaxID=2883479 RepID=A0A9X1ICD8_9PROT|nr:Zn-ribbon domain-containing OB-fold protein [Roseicella aerolata]MCB4821339.1 Zn-ribbon domain-containing OB-fold protein [Roseicella aerolata]